MYPMSGVPHNPYGDPYYVPIRQVSPYTPSQTVVHEQLNGSSADCNRQGQQGRVRSCYPDVLDAPWDKTKEDLFEQLKTIYPQPENEKIIRQVIQNGEGKNLETLAAELADLVHGN